MKTKHVSMRLCTFRQRTFLPHIEAYFCSRWLTWCNKNPEQIGLHKQLSSSFYKKADRSETSKFDASVAA